MEKQKEIVEMFNEIAPTYDKANRVISFGIDTSWRKNACKIVLKKIDKKDINIIDVACGTGDMMGIWEDISKKFGIKINDMIGIDPSVGMLNVAKKKFPNYKFITAKADDTTLDSNFGDILSISYGIRNVVQRKEALSEFNRVLKSGGYLVVLEFTKRKHGGLIPFFRDFYIANILPTLGGMISKNKKAYEYLPNSISNFLDKESFKDELSEAGFELELTKGYSFDVCTLFVAKKIKDI